MKKISKSAFGLYSALLVFCGTVLGTIAHTIFIDMHNMAFMDIFTTLWIVLSSIFLAVIAISVINLAE